MNSLKIGVLASHGGSNMQAIIDRIAAGQLRAQIVLVISNNSHSGAMDRARRAHLPTLHISQVTHPDESARDRAIRDAMADAGAELIVLAGYMKRIGPLTLKDYSGKIINIHPALLPRHGGPGMYGIKPHESVLAAGDKESGATVHLVDPQYDHGTTLSQRRVPVLPGDTPESLQKRVLQIEHEIYSDVIASYAFRAQYSPIRQATWLLKKIRSNDLLSGIGLVIISLNLGRIMRIFDFVSLRFRNIRDRVSTWQNSVPHKWS